MTKTPFDRAEELICASIDMNVGIARLVDYVKSVNACTKSLLELKERSLEPLKNELDEKSMSFLFLCGQLTSCKEKALALITKYMQSRNSAEPLRGELNTIVVGRKEVIIDFISRNDLDLECLRQFFDEASLQKAVRAAIRAGVKEIAGVKFETETSYQVR